MKWFTLVSNLLVMPQVETPIGSVKCAGNATRLTGTPACQTDSPKGATMPEYLSLHLLLMHMMWIQ